MALTCQTNLERLHSEPCRPSLVGGQEADHLMGKDVRPLQSVKNCYNRRTHDHERPWTPYRINNK